MYTGNSVIVNLAMRWPILVPVIAVASAVVVTTPENVETIPQLAPIAVIVPEPTLMIQPPVIIVEDPKPEPVPEPVVLPPAPPKKIKG